MMGARRNATAGKAQSLKLRKPTCGAFGAEVYLGILGCSRTGGYRLSKNKSGALPAPECLSIIICEDVIEDARSHNKTIVNAFNRVTALTYPVQHDRLTVFLSLTGGHGKVPLTITIGGTGKSPLLELAGKVTFPNPRTVVDLVFNFRNLQLPEPGEYEAVVCFGKGQILCRRRLEAVSVSGRKKT